MRKLKRKIDQPDKRSVPLDLELVYQLAKLHCTMNEIASLCGCSVDTLERRCADIIEKGKDEGKRSLRRLQWGQAEKGNTSMIIWLGKQLLGQRDKFPDEEAPKTPFVVNINKAPYSIEHKSV